MKSLLNGFDLLAGLPPLIFPFCEAVVALEQATFNVSAYGTAGDVDIAPNLNHPEHAIR